MREKAIAVIAWWDTLDTKDWRNETVVRDVTREMDKRVDALRVALGA